MEVEGIILVISCQKHKETRLKEFKLPKDEYNGWKVIYVLADLTLDCPYKFRENFLTIRCEDSYIHLLKKVILAIEILYDNFSIKQGILRCGDDLLFNEDRLLEFLNNPKGDYVGLFRNAILNDYELETRHDYFMYSYYKDHPEDFDNPLHNLKGVNVLDYVTVPVTCYCSGVLLYVSNKACRALVDHMKAIDYNVFYQDPETKSYPYSIEDCGIGFIMYKSKITCTNYPMYNNENNFECIAYHTNKYR